MYKKKPDKELGTLSDGIGCHQICVQACVLAFPYDIRQNRFFVMVALSIEVVDHVV